MYCKGCRRIVLHPYEQDVNYYLNERHPQHETGCLYHDGGSEYPGGRSSKTDPYADVFRANETSAGVGTRDKKAADWGGKMSDLFQNAGGHLGTYGSLTGQKNRKNRKSTGSWSGSTQNRNNSGQSPESIMRRVNSERGRKHSLAGPAIIFIIWIVISLGGSLLSFVAHTARKTFLGIEDMFSSSDDSTWAADSWAEEVETLGEGELSDEEVRTIGKNCTSYGHYEADLADVTAALTRIMPEYGFNEWSEETYSYNHESGDVSWYGTEQDFDLMREGEYVGTFIVYTDTATDALHGIAADSSDEEIFYEMADVLDAVMQEFGYVDTAQSGQDLYRGIIDREDMIVSRHGEETDAFTTDYGPEIYVSRDLASGSTYYSMQFYAPGYYTSAE